MRITLAIIAIFGIVLFVGSFAPHWIASRRRINNAGGVHALSWLTFIFGVVVLGLSFGDFRTGFSALADLAAVPCVVMWLIAVVWAFAGSPSHQPAANPIRQGFPVIPAGRGRFKIGGVDRETGMDTTWYCQADDEDNAKVKAELQGIIVTKIERA